MDVSEEREVSRGHVLDVEVVETHHLLGGEVAGIGSSNDGEEAVLLHGVVQNGGLDDLLAHLLGLVLVNKLATDGRVASGDGGGLGESDAGISDEGSADEDHSAVGELGVGGLDVLSGTGLNARVLCEERDVRDTVVIEPHASVVRGVIAVVDKQKKYWR